MGRNVLPLLHFFCFITYLYLAAHVLVLSWRSALNRTCSLLVLCFALWSFSLIYTHDHAAGEQTAALFYSIGSLAWGSFASLALWFVLVFVEEKRFRKSPWFFPVLFVPPSLLVYQQWAGQVAAGYALQIWGWAFIWSDSVWSYLFHVYYLTYMVAAFVLLFRAAREAVSGVKREQARIILGTAVPPLVLASVTDVVLPRFGIHAVPNIAPAFVLIWVIGLLFVISRYRTLEITPELAVDHIVSSMADPLLILDAEGSIAFVNRAAERRLGYPQSALEGTSIGELFPVEVRERQLGEIAGKGGAGNVDCVLQSRSKERFLVDFTISEMRQYGDEVIGTVCVARDITERKRAEEQLRKAHDELEKRVEERTADLTAANQRLQEEIRERKRTQVDREESEERFRAIFDNVLNGILLADVESKRFVMANPAMCRMLGYAQQELESLGIADIHPAEDLSAVQEAFEKQARGELALAADIPVKRKDGSVFYADVNSTPVELGARTYLLGMFRDVSEKRRLEEQVRVTQRMEAIGRLAGGIAHDFNNILTVINSYSGFLLDDHADDPVAREDILVVQDAAIKAGRLTAQLLAFSRRQLQRLEVLEPNEVIRELSKMLGRLIGEDIEFKPILQPRLWRIKADRGQIEQVIMNLAVNARDAMPRGGKITVETANLKVDEVFAHDHPGLQPGSYVMLAVTDSGVGMDAETRSKIFEPFFTTKKLGKGTGLGLSTTYGIVKQSGGEIWVDSEPGRGTRFEVYLPRAWEDLGDEQSAKPSIVVARPDETVLVVEDDDNVRRAARRILANRKSTVLEARDAEEALAICAEFKERIDLMITDVIMPRMNGKELADRVRQLYPRMKIILMSGYTDDAVVERGVLTTDLPFLPKPFSSKTFLKTVYEVMDKPD